MPYSGVKDRTAKRYAEVYAFLNHLTTLEPSNPFEEIPLEVQIMKGLFYVQLYGAFEKSVNDIIETSVLLISAKSVKNNHFEKPLLSLALLNDMKSIHDSSQSKMIAKSVDLFIKAGSNNVIKLNETAFSNSLQNVWAKTINESLRALGIESPTLEKSEEVTIDEIVDRRNAVAHGRDSAAKVGEKFRVDVLRKKMDTIATATQKITDVTELHFIEKKFIKSSFKRFY